MIVKFILVVIDGESNESISSTINCACVKQGNGFLHLNVPELIEDRKYEN